MPICPNCKYEYVEGITICPDCNELLVSKEHFHKPAELSEKDWEVAFTSEKEYEIEMIKDNLESAGIEVAVLSQKDRNFPSVGDFSIVKLLVKRSDLKEAITFIEETKKRQDDQENN